MTPKEAYEKWKHLDALISDPDFLDKEGLGELISDLWQAVKEEAKKNHE